jgi:hypothetical protein
MDRWFSRAMLTALCGLGLTAGMARGQAVRVVPEAAPPAGAEVVYDGAPNAGVVMPAPEMPGADHDVVPGHFPWLRQHFMSKGVACWTSHNSPGCGSLKADCTFIFGSCRQFFGEPCFGGPPTSPAEFYYQMQARFWGPVPGYGPPPATGCSSCR